MDPTTLVKDTLKISLLVITSMVSFDSPFLELCYELRKHCDTKRQRLLDRKNAAIMDFSKKGIENTFTWISEGISYNVQDYIRFYNSLKPSSDLIRNWLTNDRKHIIGKAMSSFNRG